MSHRPDTVERRAAVFSDAIAVIQRDYARSIDLNYVAREIATSRRQLQRIFAEMGTDFRTVLREVRMQRAVELLRTGDMPVKQVAHSVGYQQPAQFAKTFRSRLGVAPSSFKGSMRNDSPSIAVR